MKRIILTLTLALFTLPILNAQDLPVYVPTEGLVAYYPFNGNANDASGNGHHGTVNGATLTTDLNDYSDKAYAFSHDGASFGDNHQSIYIPFHSDFQSETFTIGVWFKADSYGWDGNSKIESTLISKRENSNDINQATYRIQLSSSFTRSEIGSNTGSDEIPCTIDTNPINLDAWYHAASTYDGVTLRQYINGVKTSELVCDLGHNAVSTSGIMLGQTWQYNGYWYHLDGKLDEFMVYNRALSGQEMENYYVSATSDILLNGTVSAENNQIKNVADPTDAQDAATKSYVDSNVNAFSGSYNDLADKPAATYTQAQVDALIQNLQTQIDGLTPPQGTAAINHNNKTYSSVYCEGFWLGFKFSVSETQTITALGAWDEGHNVDVNNEYSSCPDASNFSVPIAIYKNDVLVLEKVINASTGFVIGSSRYIKIDDFVLNPGDEYFIIGNYEGSSKYGYFDSNLVTSNYDSRITPLSVTSSPLFSRNTDGDGTFPSNLTTLSDNQWSDQYFHVNFLLKN